MNSVTTTEQGSALPERGRRRRKILGCLVATLIFALIGLWWLQTRGGETVERPLVALLPEGTPIALQIHDLHSILEAYDRSELARIIATDVQVGALLLNSSDLRDLREKRQEAELEYHLSLGREFLLDWAGEEMTLAFVPTGEKPALVAITQAQLGFREKLAELMAQLYPGSDISTREHRGVTITSFIDEESRDSFSFCRFGETVAVALRTDQTTALEQIIDAVSAESPPEQPVFPPPTQPGVHGWINVDLLPDCLSTLESGDVDQWLATEAGQEVLGEFTSTFSDVRLTHTLDDPRSLRLTLQAKEDAWPLPSSVTDWHRLTRPTTLLATHIEPPASIFASLVHSMMEGDPAEETDAEDRWRLLLHDWFNGEIRPMLSDSPTLVIDSVTPRLGLPAVRACLRWPIVDDPGRVEVALLQVTSDFQGTIFADLEREQIPTTLLTRPTNLRLADHQFQTWPTPVGRLQWAIVGGDLTVMLDDPADPLVRQWITGWETTARSASHHRDLVAMWGEASRPGEFFVHLGPLAELSTAVLSSAALFSDSARRKLNRMRMAAALVEVYPAMGIACLWDEKALTVDLSITRVTE